MSYLLIGFLVFRVFISEQVSVVSGVIFNIIFCLAFILFVFFKENLKLKKPLFFFGLLLLFSIYISSIFSVNRFDSERELLNFCTLFLIFLFVSLINRKQRSLLVKGVLLAALVIALRAIYQHLFTMSYIKNHFSYQEITKNGFYALELLKQGRIISWFTSPNLLAGYLVMVIPISAAFLAEALKEKNKLEIFFYTAAFLILFIALILAKSIGAYLSFIVAACFFFLAAGRLRSKKTKPYLKFFIIFPLAVLLIFTGVFFSRSKYFINTANPDNSFIQRANYWKAGFKIIRQYPLTGVGLGNYGTVYPRFKEQKANETIYAHNSYLQLWAESGPLSLIALWIFIGIVFKNTSGKSFNLLVCGTASGCIAFIVHNFVTYDFFIPQASFLWWILLGHLAAKDRQEKTELSYHASFPARALRLSCLFLGFLFLYNNFLDLNSQLNADSALMLYQQKDYDVSNRAALNSLRYKSNNDFAYYIMAHNFQKKNPKEFSREAFQNYKKAIALNSEYAFYYYETGKYLLKFHRKKLAKNFFAQALKLYPNNPKFLHAFYSN